MQKIILSVLTKDMCYIVVTGKGSRINILNSNSGQSCNVHVHTNMLVKDMDLFFSSPIYGLNIRAY